jgi:carbonic anhydrase
MKRILEGLQRFQDEIFPEERELFARLASSQSPEALFLTCSDARIVPELLTQTRPGELFICRNAGNIAPAFVEHTGGVSATIEYAVVALHVRDIIICGHSDCGAMRGLMNPEQVAHMPTVALWLRHAEKARELAGPMQDEAAYLDRLIEQNVLVQLDNLRTHPCVEARVRDGQLGLHGWVFDIRSGTVRAFDAAHQRFVPILGQPRA